MLRICGTCGLRTESETCPNDGQPTAIPPDPLVGQMIGGRYQVLKQIGAGGYGAVYKAQHATTKDIVAIKVLHASSQQDPEVGARFRREAQATSALKHPNTVRVFDFGELPDGGMYLAMEFLEGTPLSDLMHRGAMEFRRLVPIALQVLKALSEAHGKGLVHRDLKPDNIFLQTVHGEADFVKVLDFGIAKSMVGGLGGDLTSTGVIIGTPNYMSPEQARGKDVDHRTDLYALSCILFEGLTGEVPFPAESALDMLLRRLTESPPRPHTRVKFECPDAICDVVLAAMAKEQKQRPQTADAMAAALQDGMGDNRTASGRMLAVPTPISQAAVTMAQEEHAAAQVTFMPGQQPALPTMPSGAAPTALPTMMAQRPATATARGAALLAEDGDAATIATDSGALKAAIAARQAQRKVEPAAPSQAEFVSAPTLQRSAVAEVAPAAPKPKSKLPLLVAGAVGLAALAGVAFVATRAGEAPQAAPAVVQAAKPVPVVAEPASAPAPVAAAPAPVAAAPAPVAAVPAPVAAPAAPSPAPVAVSWAALPAATVVEVDGAEVTGTSANLAPGKHKVRATLAGHSAWSEEIEVKPGEPQVLAIKLTKLAAIPAAPRAKPKAKAESAPLLMD